MKQEKIQEIRLLINDEEVLDEADEILGEELARLNRQSRYCYKPCEIAKVFGMSGADLKSLVWTEQGRQFLLDIIYGRK